MDDGIMRAMLFAEACHEGQFRRFTGEPYITHPRRVAAQAVRLGLPDWAIQVAFLHDVIEDCHVTQEELEKHFGKQVAEGVWALSDMQTPDDGNRNQRHKAHLEKIAKEGAEIQTIAVLDVTDNARSLIGHDPKFWFTAALKEATDVVLCLDEAFPKAREGLTDILQGRPKWGC